MLTTHGREPYEGARRVLVTMTDRIDAPSVAPPETYAIPTIAPRVADIVVD